MAETLRELVVALSLDSNNFSRNMVFAYTLCRNEETAEKHRY